MLEQNYAAVRWFELYYPFVIMDGNIMLLK